MKNVSITAKIASTVIIYDDVVIEDNVIIHDYVVLYSSRPIELSFVVATNTLMKTCFPIVILPVM